ncbi:hypothetical protein FKM82_011274 [Ascaphus truei]
MLLNICLIFLDGVDDKLSGCPKGATASSKTVCHCCPTISKSKTRVIMIRKAFFLINVHRKGLRWDTF